MTKRWERISVILLIIAVLAAAVILRLRLARMAHFPGHGDYAYYYTVAANIADGKGLQIDYVWHYLNGLPPITHYSSDFWMPLTSILTSLPMLVLGKSLWVGILPAILAGVSISVPAYLLGKAFSNSRLVAFTSAGLILFLPVLFKYSLLTDSSVYYTLLVSTSLWLMVKGNENPRLYLPAAGLIGVAHLTRQDGVLVFATLALVISLASMPCKTKLAYVLLSLGIYAAVLSPLIFKNLQEFGAPFPPGPSKTMFLTTYEDFYAYGKTFSLEQYLAQGIDMILSFKFQTIVYNLEVIYKSLGAILTVLACAGAIDHAVTGSLRARWRAFLPPVILFAGIYVFYTLVASYSSYGTGFRRSLMSVTPFLVVLAVDFIYRRLRWKPLAVAICVALMVMFAWQAYPSARALIIEHNALGAELASLHALLVEDAAKQGLSQQAVVLMARDAWEVYEAVQVKTIQIPNNDLETIYQIAGHYQANYILLPAKRQALEPLYSGEVMDARFTLVGQVPASGLKLFRIR